MRADGNALIVRAPQVLARFSLERVLTQIIATGDEGAIKTPTELLQRLFDTENNASGKVFADNSHCDDYMDPYRSCPRAEGKLARSTGLFQDGHADFFAPVAIVSRFDLTPSTLASCGEYRIVYAKYSGRTDPNNRLFLIFEGILPNPGKTLHYGLNHDASCSYSGVCGQVRIGQGMQEPWQFLQFRINSGPSGKAFIGPHFQPTNATNMISPGRFDLDSSVDNQVFARTF